MPSPPFPAPAGRTVRRVEWAHLPPAVRVAVEQRIGTPVVEARSQTSGFTPGFASVLIGADGSRHFVKAAALKAQRAFATAYRDEAHHLAGLPRTVAAPRLRWSCEADGWFVMATEYVDGRSPVRPWREAELLGCLDALAGIAVELTPAPAAMSLPSLSSEVAGWPAHWTYLLDTFVLDGGAEAAALAADHHRHLAGRTVVHGDVRPDNLLLAHADDGAAVSRVSLCDWNWPSRGPAWFDSLSLLVDAFGDGLDVEAVLATHPTFAGVDPDALDCALALLTGYLLRHGDLPAPVSSPYLREVQQWRGDACWTWLSLRRGWAGS